MAKTGKRACCFILFIVTNFSKSVSFIVTPDDTLAIQGDSAQLNCSFEASLFLKWWYHSSGVISAGDEIRTSQGDYELVIEGDEYNLRVHNVTSIDEDKYECHDNSETNKATAANIYVIDSGPNCSTSHPEIVIEGETIVFKCIIDINENAPGYLIWLKEGEEVSRKEGQNNTWVTQLSRSDNNAIFDCQLQHYTLPPWKWSTISCVEKLQIGVQYAPEVSIDYGAQNQMREGADFNATCEATDANPEKIEDEYWVGPDGEKVSETRSLILVDVSREMSGDYTCVMSNVFYNGVEGNGTATVEVDVQYLSAVNMTVTPSFNITEGDEVTLHCEALDGNPHPHRLELLFEDNIIKHNNGSVLQHTIASVEGYHSGIYQCNAYTIFYDDGKEHSSITLDIVVYYSPKFVSDELIYEANIDDIVLMSCEVHGFPTPVITWFDQNNDLILSDEEYIKITVGLINGELVLSTLTVTVADESYYGTYTCKATNNIPPDDEQTMEIVKPSSNSAAIATTITVVVVVLLVAIVLGILYYYNRVAKYQSSNTDYANAGIGTDDHSELTANFGNDRQEPEGVSQEVDPNPNAESTALSQKKSTPTGLLKENPSYVSSKHDYQGDKEKEGDLLRNPSALYAAVNKHTKTADGVNDVNDTAGNHGNKEDQETPTDVTEMYAKSRKQNPTTKKAPKADITYADLDLTGSGGPQQQSQSKPTETEKTQYASIQITPSKQ